MSEILGKDINTVSGVVRDELFGLFEEIDDFAWEKKSLTKEFVKRVRHVSCQINPDMSGKDDQELINSFVKARKALLKEVI